MIIALLAQNYSRFAVWLNYELNKDYIARNICENRNKPRSCCKGKCFLKKQMAKADKEENLPGNSHKEKYEEIYFFVSERIVYPPSIKEITKQYYLRNLQLVSQHFVDKLLRPPRFA